MDDPTLSDATSVSPESSFHPRRDSIPDRPCDICRKRKSRCVKESGQTKCVLCTFHQRDCTYLDAPARRKRKRQDDQEPKVPHRTVADDSVSRHGQSLLDSTLGLHQSSHSRYVGPSSFHEPSVWALKDSNFSSGNLGYARILDEDTFFVTETDSQTPFHADEITDIDEIERTVTPHGPKLVDVYFRIVHPSFPILHKGVFLEKYARSYREFSPPLLAAVYLLAMDWWEYDMDLSQESKPNGERLLQLATKAFTSVVLRPKLSTVQAGLLALQRSGGSSWVMTSQVVAVAEELGLHQDCSTWSIPEWEKGLRRRLAWAVFMQDTWTAALHGRPSHVNLSTWSVRRVVLSDFPETAADQDDQDGSTEVEKGRHLFIHLTTLTEILVDIVRMYDPSGQSHVPALEDVLHQAKPIAMHLREWKASIPSGLFMEDVTARKLCSNGYMHLAYYTNELLLHRQIIRCCSSESDPALVSLCREAANLRLEHAITLVDQLRPEHLHAFWWFASPVSLALIGSYTALLWATSSSANEAGGYKTKMEEYRWILKLRAKGVNFVTAAMQELERSVPALDDRLWPREPLPQATGGETGDHTRLAVGLHDTPRQTPNQLHFDWDAFDEAFSPFPTHSFLPQRPANAHDAS